MRAYFFSIKLFLTLALVFYSINCSASDKDSTEVLTQVEKYRKVWNTHDAAALALFFTEDADFIMGNLPLINGRDGIQNWWQNYFNGQEPERGLTITVNSLRIIAPDVALVNVATTTGGQETQGEKLKSRKARGTWLLQRQNGNWLITAICGMPTERDSIILGASTETAESLHPHVRAFVKAYENAYDSHDPSAVTTFFQEDADITVRNKPLVHGKQAIQEWWSSYFSTPRNFKVIMIIDEIRTITNDVVQVNLTVTGAIPGTEDNLQPLRQTSAMWVLVRETDGWRIAALRVLPGKDDQIIRAVH